MGVASHIEHGEGSAHFEYRPSPPYVQLGKDGETNGNAGLCPSFNPNSYDQDECFIDGDAGLIIPEPYTIAGDTGSESVVPCSGYSGSALGETCQTATWGENVDIFVDNSTTPASIAYVNVLMDWNHDGSWSGSSMCYTSVPEHVLVNFAIPAGYVGTLSNLSPPSFNIGPNPGYVWARFSITDVTVASDWDGSGEFDGGETEDYLLRVDPSCGVQADFETIMPWCIYGAPDWDCDGPTDVTFMDKSTGDITKWEWNFDVNINETIDETYSEHQDIVLCHYYYTGIYTISLTVYGDDCQHTLTRYNYIYVQC